MSHTLQNPSQTPGSEKRTAGHLGFLAFTLLCFFAASSAPTPLYHLYQASWGFSAAILTLIFSVYAFSLLVALLVVGSLSDYLGRRPVIFATGAGKPVDADIYLRRRCQLAVGRPDPARLCHRDGDQCAGGRIAGQ